MEPGWPADHAIGVYLSVGGLKTLVATARSQRDVGPVLRYLADAWDSEIATQNGCGTTQVDSSWLFDAHAVTSLPA